MASKTLHFFYLILIFTQFILAKNYYVNPNVGSMQNDGSINLPWSTLDSVALLKSSLFEGGDTLFLYSGYHGDKVILNNNPKLKIVITAVKNNIPKFLNFTVKGSNWVLNNLVFTQEGNDGLGVPGNFYNGTHLILLENSRNNIIQNCKFFSTENSENWTLSDWRGNVWNGVIDYGKNNILRNNSFNNIAYAIQLMQQCDSAIVRSNFINNFSGDGIRVCGADYCLVENNIVKNSIELDDNSYDGNHEDAIQAWDFNDGVNNLIVRGNLIINYENIEQPFRGPMQGMGFFDGFYNDCIIENNIIIVEHWHGISLYGAKNCKIINNTVLQNPGGSNAAGPPWIGIFNHKDGRESTDNIVRNNLSTDLSITTGSSLVDHNIAKIFARDFCEDYDNFNFYPDPKAVVGGEIIIDQGSIEDAPHIDFLGTSRPQGAGYDIGAFEYSDSISVGIDDKRRYQYFSLDQNYPNPFNPITVISYTIPANVISNERNDVRNLNNSHFNQNNNVIMKVYDVLGREIATLINEPKAVGKRKISFDASNLTSGVYYYQLKVDNYLETKKMILLK